MVGCIGRITTHRGQKIGIEKCISQNIDESYVNNGVNMYVLFQKKIFLKMSIKKSYFYASLRRYRDRYITKYSLLFQAVMNDCQQKETGDFVF